MMSKRFLARGHVAGAFALLGVAFLTTGCQSTARPEAGGGGALDAAQPRSASYDCGGGGLVTVENRGVSVRILGADGVPVELPASPASQRNRYGQGGDAIVLEGREALIMRRGQEPLTCMR